MAAISATLLPRMFLPTAFSAPRWATYYTQMFAPRILPSLSIALPSITLGIPALLGDIWESVLRAAPKKKPSHSRRRHKQMAGKALKDVNNLCKCPGCGQPKRTHRLCQDCHAGKYICRAFLITAATDLVLEMKNIWRDDTTPLKMP